MSSAHQDAPTHGVETRTVHALRRDGDEDLALLRDDALAIEEPMEIRLQHPWRGKEASRSVSITMRTPGHDFELAVGFLYTEGIVRAREEIAGVQYCGAPELTTGHRNVVRVDLTAEAEVDWKRLQRHFYTTSSCGVCGKASLDALEVSGCPVLGPGPALTPTLIHALPARLRQAQEVFTHTGGLHAAGLFDARGEMLVVREDVGRHNAVDKVIGARLLDGALPADDTILMVSGRASFELVQKAVVAGVPVLVAVSAPSSLACALAERHGLTLVGFARNDRFNVYTHPQRLGDSLASAPAHVGE